jgi:hypothetical protein
LPILDKLFCVLEHKFTSLADFLIIKKIHEMYEQICRNHSSEVGSLDCASPSRKICKFGIVPNQLELHGKIAICAKMSAFTTVYKFIIDSKKFNKISLAMKLCSPVVIQLAKKSFFEMFQEPGSFKKL